MTPKSGPKQKMYFDATSFLLVRTASSINTPELGMIEQMSDMSDYRSIDGIKVAFVMHQMAGPQEIVLTFTKVEHNVPIDDAVFVKK